MPLALLWPVLGGSVGFATGYFTGNGVGKLVKAAAVVGVGYVVYTQVIKK